MHKCVIRIYCLQIEEEIGAVERYYAMALESVNGTEELANRTSEQALELVARSSQLSTEASQLHASALTIESVRVSPQLFVLYIVL